MKRRKNDEIETEVRGRVHRKLKLESAESRVGEWQEAEDGEEDDFMYF